MKSQNRKASAGLLALLVLGMATGCSDRQQASQPQLPVKRPPTIATPAPATTPAPSPSPPPAQATATVQSWLLNLDGEGLRIFNSNTGASRLITFGADSTQSADTLGRVLGEPVPVAIENEECQMTFSRWRNGLTVWSNGTKFVGWSLTPQSTTLATSAGLTLGSSRSDLKTAYQVKIFESSLGTEFIAGGVGGLLDSARADARITNLWAGQTCIAR